MTLEDVLRDPEFFPYVRRWMFEQMAAGLLAPERAVAVARRIGVELEAGAYAVALFDLPPKSREGGYYSDPAEAVRSGLLAYFLKYSEYMPVQMGPDLGAVLIKGEPVRMEELTDRCIRTVREQHERGGMDGWHLAVSGQAAGLEELPDRFQEAFRLWSMRALRPGQRIFRAGAEDLPVPDGGEAEFSNADLVRADPAVIGTFLENGRREDVPVFARRYLEELGPAMGSRAFRDYALLGARAAAWGALRALGLSEERCEAAFGSPPDPGRGPERFLRETLSAALALRDETSGKTRGGTLKTAVEYVNGHFTDPELSLAETAAHAGVTASYLSALFWRELDRTFTQYVTDRRMEFAKRLLRATDRRAGQIARSAGFRDGHYFNALFKKTQGCTPSQFRAGARIQDGQRGAGLMF